MKGGINFAAIVITHRSSVLRCSHTNPSYLLIEWQTVYSPTRISDVDWFDSFSRKNRRRKSVIRYQNCQFDIYIIQWHKFVKISKRLEEISKKTVMRKIMRKNSNTKNIYKFMESNEHFQIFDMRSIYQCQQIEINQENVKKLKNYTNRCLNCLFDSSITLLYISKLKFSHPTMGSSFCTSMQLSGLTFPITWINRLNSRKKIFIIIIVKDGLIIWLLKEDVCGPYRGVSMHLI